MPQPAAFLRAYAGLGAHSGRTIALAGPPTSGKSALLQELKAELEKLPADRQEQLRRELDEGKEQ